MVEGGVLGLGAPFMGSDATTVVADIRFERNL